MKDTMTREEYLRREEAGEITRPLTWGGIHLHTENVVVGGRSGSYNRGGKTPSLPSSGSPQRPRS